MDIKQALRILNLIGATSQSQTELRYFQLRSGIEILIENAGTLELKQMYRETAQSVEEAYNLLTQGKEVKLLAAESGVRENGSEADIVSNETREALSKMRSSLSEIHQIRTYLQQYSALLEVQLAKAEDVIKKVETQTKAFDDLTGVIQDLRATAERNVHEIALCLEDAKQMDLETQKRKSELTKITTASTGKSKFLDAIAGRTRLNQFP